MIKNLLNTKVTIEVLEKKLSDDNLWVSEYKAWKDVWASVLIKDISSRRVLYFFTIKWSHDFPRDFRVIIKNKIFTPTQPPIIEPASGLVLFHATIN